MKKKRNSGKAVARKKHLSSVTLAAVAKQHKFGAIPTIVDGIRFASAKEAKRYGELKLLEKGGAIRDLRLQVAFPIVITTRYVADFVYIEDGRQVVEDVKGFRTKEYIRKRKYLLQQHNISIKET